MISIMMAVRLVRQAHGPLAAYQLAREWGRLVARVSALEQAQAQPQPQAKPAAKPAPAASADVDEDALAALRALGIPKARALEALRAISAEAAAADTAERVRLALQRL